MIRSRVAPGVMQVSIPVDNSRALHNHLGPRGRFRKGKRLTGESSGARAPSRAAHRGAPRVRWRALLGAALVTASAFGVLFAHRVAQRPPDDRYVVVTSEVAAGQALEASQLGTVAIDLPTSVDAVPAERAEDVIGRLANHTLRPSSLLAGADLLERDRFARPGETEVAVSLDPARTPVGQFAVGDTVTLVATDETGTAEVTDAARVTSLDDGEEAAIGAPSRIHLGLAVPDSEAALAVVDAAVNAELTIALTAPEPEEAP